LVGTVHADTMSKNKVPEQNRESESDLNFQLKSNDKHIPITQSHVTKNVGSRMET